MKNVLIALDYDPTAKIVADKGGFLSKTMNAKITLLHVISKPVLYYASYHEIAPLLKNEDELKATSKLFLDQLKKDLRDESIRTIVKEGDTSDCILKTAKDTNADVIVLGTHSRKWLENIVMGSVAESVLKHSTLPLFIIPTKKQRD
ncbi:universal stress protein [Williamwhitmania taraxaci]|uniref:Universal stress protein n=1 Tax=Williamwhitmania taraxaci TaxID=1640674 RepID=A0A1G6H3P3_9BACT|nr:universal stress protein [Williamwhitmania taraxaci]SDB88036.1 Nucleotide-binding universal stress protein, UspA family [Williamwhitmania taraxaci]